MIVWKALLCGVIAVAQISASPAPPEVTQYQHPLVKQVLCLAARGTAFRVDGNRMLSVDHVTDNVMCTIDGVRAKAVAEPGDFSVIHTAPYTGNSLKINCDGFVPGEYYFAVGYAGGKATQKTVRLLATKGTAQEGMVILWGSPTVIPGMSGGPVLSADGEVVGTVNMFSMQAPLSLSRQLKDTSVCSNA
jgi:hypothetical protein